MTPRSDSKRLAPIRVLFSDPWRKLAAIGLAILLWFWLDDQITDDELIELRLETVNSATHPGARETLQVTVDGALYFVSGFYNRVTDEKISHVKIMLSGAQHLMKRLNDNNGFRVTPTIDAGGGSKKSFEFTINDVHPLLPEVQSLLLEMTPASVRVDLIANTQVHVPLNPGLLQINAPAEALSRLLPASAEFSAKTVSLLGPADQISTLQRLPRVFAIDVINATLDATEVQGTLRLIENPSLDKVHFATGEPITVTVPLKVAFRTYTATVPYVLDKAALPPEMRDKFQATETAAEIDIEVSHNLELALVGMNEHERQEWIRQHARLWVRLPMTATESDTYTPEFLIVGRQYEQGIDYKVVDRKPLRVERIP